MIKATSTFIAAVAALTLSGGAYAQAPGGSSDSNTSGGTANQMPGAAGGYGMPGAAKSDSGMVTGVANNTTMTTAPALPALPNNNTLATPSVKSPAGGQ
jgi:hypothetical protein